MFHLPSIILKEEKVLAYLCALCSNKWNWPHTELSFVSRAVSTFPSSCLKGHEEPNASWERIWLSSGELSLRWEWCCLSSHFFSLETLVIKISHLYFKRDQLSYFVSKSFLIISRNLLCPLAATIRWLVATKSLRFLFQLVNVISP